MSQVSMDDKAEVVNMLFKIENSIYNIAEEDNGIMLSPELKQRIQQKYQNESISLEMQQSNAQSQLQNPISQRPYKVSQSLIMTQHPTRKFLQRQRKVKDNYLFTTQELQQKMAIINLFEKFDADGSGALDYQELAILYNDNGVPITEEEIKQLYNDENPKFTLKMFEQFTKEMPRLRSYRQALNKIKYRLLAEAKMKAQRAFIPATFDTMMLDFGKRVQRKELINDYQSICQKIIKSARVDTAQLKTNFRMHADQLQKLLQNNQESLQMMDSCENYLFRRTLADHNRKQAELQSLIAEQNKFNTISSYHSNGKQQNINQSSSINDQDDDLVEFEHRIQQPTREAKRQVASFLQTCQGNAQSEARQFVRQTYKIPNIRNISHMSQDQYIQELLKRQKGSELGSITCKNQINKHDLSELRTLGTNLTCFSQKKSKNKYHQSVDDYLSQSVLEVAQHSPKQRQSTKTIQFTTKHQQQPQYQSMYFPQITQKVKHQNHKEIQNLSSIFCNKNISRNLTLHQKF